MVNLNGIIVATSAATISTNNRGLAYGDALFETIRVSAGKIFFAEDHYFRLMASMRILRMEIPMNFTQEFLESELLRTIEASEMETKTCIAKITVYRNQGGLYTPTDQTVGYFISVREIDAPFYLIHEEAYEVELFKDHYINSGLLTTLKTNNKIVNVLGSIYASENEYQNCLLLNEKKQVVEALNGNLFLVKGTTIKTPPLNDGCLKGILRKQIITICKSLPDYTLEEASISPFELQKADELFITNVVVGIQSITKYRKKEYTKLAAKDLLGKLNTRVRLG
ncbi:MAG: branched-chain amino acid aminotransferase [Patiriisocius sp.]|jgi:branched-chain amino acid aminotransferase